MAEAVENAKAIMIEEWKRFLFNEDNVTLNAFRAACEAHLQMYLKYLKTRN